MIQTIKAFMHWINHLPHIKRLRNRRDDRYRDRIIRGHYAGEKKVSELIDCEAIDEGKARDSYCLTYQEALREVEKLVDASNRAGNHEIRLHEVENIDTGKKRFQTTGGLLPKFTLTIGKDHEPVVNILFITGTHGEESRLWRSGLEAVIQLSRPGRMRGELLSRVKITFDLFSDIYGFDNQTRGYVARDGIQVNEHLLGQRGYQGFGLRDRAGEQGSQSKEAQSVLTRSNHAHYRKVCGDLTWIGDHHETNENIGSYPSLHFRYGGIMLMAHIYMTAEELHRLGVMRRCLAVSDRVRKFINNWSPLQIPLFRDQLLYNHPSLRKLRQIRDRIRDLGQHTFEDGYEKVMVGYPHVERDFSLDESIWMGGEVYRIAGIRLGPDVLAPEGMTTESFQQDLVVRLRQTLAAMEAQLMVIGLGSRGGKLE
jgi:hypothetical protein